MSQHEDKIKFALTIDASYMRQIRNLMLLKNQSFENNAILIEGSIARDILSLSQGLYFPLSLTPELLKYAGDNNDLSFYLTYLGDKNLEDEGYLKNYKDGIIMHSMPNAHRTSIIKKWSGSGDYDCNPRGTGFKSAVGSIVRISNSFIEVQSSFEMMFNISPNPNLLSTKIDGPRDWESIWSFYNTLFYGRGYNEIVSQDVRIQAERIGLNNKTLFREVLDTKLNKVNVYGALALIDLLVRTAKANWER